MTEGPHNEINARLPWLEVEDGYLSKEYCERGTRIDDIAKALGRSYDSVSSRVGVLRLRKKNPMRGPRKEIPANVALRREASPVCYPQV